ncbi:MAG: sugar-transfer associated ATP-grasp domain-containing protein, partial [Pseudomonadota bacterium]
GVRITGTKLPFWEEAKALALDAHDRGFREYNLVGWDVAITPDGPMLIEGNGQPSMIIAQRGSRRGVGGTRLGELIVHHLREAGALDA